MPASLLTDMNSHGGGDVEEQRALQLALELSMLGLNTDDEGNANHALNVANAQSFSEEAKMRKSANMTECVPVPSSEHVAEIVGRQGCKIKALRAKTNTYIKTPVRGEEPVFVVTGRKEDVGAAKREILSAAEHFSQIRASRRNNANSTTSSLAPGPPSPNAPGQVTIQVRVPYRVVGLVVGPKGATIKRIQQQTHTYIVTPSRDKEPVFEVTGTPENVDKARQEIESHIAMRTGGIVDANLPPSPQVSNVGLPPSVPLADEAHLNQLNDFHSNGVESGFQDLSQDLLSSIYKGAGSNSAFTSSYSALNNSNNLMSHPVRSQDLTTITSNMFNLPVINGSNKLGNFTTLTNAYTNGFGCFYDNEEAMASPAFDASCVPVTSTALWSDLTAGEPQPPILPMYTNNTSNNMPQRRNSLSNSTTPRLSPTLTNSSSSSPPALGMEHVTVRRIQSDPLSNGLISAFSPLGGAGLVNGLVSTSTSSPINSCSSSSSGGSSSCSASMSSSTSTSASPTAESGPGSPPRGLGIGGTPRSCVVCSDSDIVAALVPCGHNLFCIDCANHIVSKPQVERRCPVCQQTPSQAIRIFS